MEEHIKIYEIKHPAFRKNVEILVKADSMEEAIKKFNERYQYDYDIDTSLIEGCYLKYDFEVIE